jgi:hypothetical protein
LAAEQLLKREIQFDVAAAVVENILAERVG